MATRYFKRRPAMDKKKILDRSYGWDAMITGDMAANTRLGPRGGRYGPSGGNDGGFLNEPTTVASRGAVPAEEAP